MGWVMAFLRVDMMGRRGKGREEEEGTGRDEGENLWLYGRERCDEEVEVCRLVLCRLVTSTGKRWSAMVVSAVLFRCAQPMIRRWSDDVNSSPVVMMLSSVRVRWCVARCMR
jgi:hypothetical protein